MSRPTATADAVDVVGVGAAFSPRLLFAAAEVDASPVPRALRRPASPKLVRTAASERRRPS